MSPLHVKKTGISTKAFLAALDNVLVTLTRHPLPPASEGFSNSRSPNPATPRVPAVTHTRSRGSGSVRMGTRGVWLQMPYLQRHPQTTSMKQLTNRVAAREGQGLWVPGQREIAVGQGWLQRARLELSLKDSTGVQEPMKSKDKHPW